jgi:hypothetical protein
MLVLLFRSALEQVQKECSCLLFYIIVTRGMENLSIVFIYVLFNDAVSSSHYTAPNGRMIVKNELKGRRKV